MNNRALNTFWLAFLNLKKKIFRTVAMIIVTGILSFAVFGGWILAQSIQRGIDSTVSRLGANLMIIPTDSESSLEGTLLRGEPSTFYMDASDISDKIGNIEGIEKTSTQMYIATLNASCCTIPVQLIGIDTDTDFIVGSWISSSSLKELGDDEIIVGSDVGGEIGYNLRFYNISLKIESRLSKTGMGYDSSVFMNMNTARKLMAQTQTAQNSNVAVEDMASAVMIKVSENADISKVKAQIEEVLGVKQKVITSQSVLQDVSKVLASLSKYSYLLIIILWILTAAVLNLIFVLNFNERKKEFSILRIIGAKRKTLIKTVLTESMLVCLCGAVAGIALAAVIIFPFSISISDSLGLPYLTPGGGEIILTVLLSLAVTLISGVLASVYSAIKVSRAEIYIMIKENE